MPSDSEVWEWGMRRQKRLQSPVPTQFQLRSETKGAARRSSTGGLGTPGYIHLVWKAAWQDGQSIHVKDAIFTSAVHLHNKPFIISMVHANVSEWPASLRLQSKVQQYVRGADQPMLEQMRLTVFEVVVGVLRSKEFMNDIPKAVETACKVSSPVFQMPNN